MENLHFLLKKLGVTSEIPCIYVNIFFKKLQYCDRFWNLNEEIYNMNCEHWKYKVRNEL